MSRRVWFQLVDEYGSPYKGTSATKAQTSEAADVDDFKDAVKIECPNKLSFLDPSDLRVYTNKGSFDRKEEPLKPSCTLADFGQTMEEALIVLVPESPPISPYERWKDEEPCIYSLDSRRLFFVNRTEAMEQLHRVHKDKYYRSTGSGADWKIPLADNVLGLGKSDLALNYIRKSREMWPDVEKRDVFQKTLCECHTLFIVFDIGELVDVDFNKVMLARLKSAVATSFVKPPEIHEETARDYLKTLTERHGPIFIVLDEIGMAFSKDSKTFVEMRETFLRFCSEVSRSWNPNPNLFFVLLGNAYFLLHVGYRPDEHFKMTWTTFTVQRLNIHLIRTEFIAEIINKTYVRNDKMQTIRDSLNLNNDGVQEASQLLFEKTLGHPRSLLEALLSCKSLEDIRDYDKPVYPEDWDAFYNAVSLYRKELQKLFSKMLPGLEKLERGQDLTKDDSVNLSELVSETRLGPERTMTYDIIANNSMIYWHGSVEKAYLYPHPHVKQLLEGLIFTFDDYLNHITKNIDTVSLDFANVFEWICLMKFQQLFAEHAMPSKIHPLFFNTPVFGNCSDLHVSERIRQIPKVTTQASLSSWDIDSYSIHPDNWSKLLLQIDLLGDICLKPRAKSASSDAFVITSANYQSAKVKLTIGLAVKNYLTAKFSFKNLMNECTLFNDMFHGLNLDNSKNILIICCTNYDKTLLSRFQGKLSYALDSKELGSIQKTLTKSKDSIHIAKAPRVQDPFSNIHEVILLDLSTLENRSKFFNSRDDLQNVIERVIQKGEPESSQ